MEAEKVKEKAKRVDYQANFNSFQAIGLLCFTFFALSVMTSHRSIGALPEPQFFSLGGIVLTIVLMALPVIAFLDGLAKFSRLIIWVIILLALSIIGLPITYSLAFFGSWIVNSWVYQPLQVLPVMLFPLLFLVSLVLYRFSLILERIASLRLIQISSLCVTWIAALYIWGQTTTFAGDYYDESIAVEGKTYHLITHDGGWRETPNYTTLYECLAGYFFCNVIYRSDTFYYGALRADTTSLLYDAGAKVLRLEHISEFDEMQVSIMYEHPIP